MVLLRRVIGDALRARRQGQHRTLREVSSAANVSLGYLSEIERGQKEASSELLAAICDALGARLSELLSEVSDTVALAEQMSDVLAPVQERSAVDVPARGVLTETGVRTVTESGVRQVATDGNVSVSVRQDSPLKATLRTTRRVRSTNERGREVVRAA
ncbi:helix-turn-helix domain-containing protein [Micromonospora sp. NPDC050397]|uniref:helix-turn-helix domain-containing protein n=1 Tax=Micromonospora sp. NPDC050397 TaxID=3364279 RepID=UPI00384ABB89